MNMPRKPKAGVAAEVTLTLRMTDHDRALLDRLVTVRAAELSDLGAEEADVTAASYVRGLIRREAKAKGITVGIAAAPAPEATPAAKENDPAAIRAALEEAIRRGEAQAQIAKRAGVDAGALSRFRKTGTGIAGERLQKLARTLS